MTASQVLAPDRVTGATTVWAAVQQCRARAAAYLQAHACSTEQEHWWRHSRTHHAQSHADHVLYGTWAGVLASVLLGADRSFGAATRQRIHCVLSRFQRPDGTFLMAAVPESQRRGQDIEYFTFHCTNYAVGAARALAVPLRYPLAFLERQLASAADLQAWLARRDWARPWHEGNNIVNLASFYAILAEDGATWAGERLQEMAEWHDAHQHPTTGLWHGRGAGRGWLWHALAGGAHNLHLYYYLGRRVPHGERIIDTCLRLGYPGITSACLDIDMVDILCHLRPLGHRVSEIDFVLTRYLLELLQVQNADGGFCDNYVTPHVLYGHRTPAGVSVTWTTYFRLATIGMIAATFYPEDRAQWTFRNTMGMGYYHPADAHRWLPSHTGRWVMPQLLGPLQVWLSERRRLRWTRQRLTQRIRSWLA